ncbi:MAG: hypothetical protein Q4E01_07030, partial [Actinomycetaceae bacterium]|nr:hypothetical protein [Actinomycetaceae bacterium]
GGKPGSTSVAENKKTPQSGSTATGAPAGRKQVWPGAPFGGASAQQTKVSRGGAPAAGTSSSLLTSLPLPQDLMESANEGAPENTQEVPEQAGESASSLESATAPSEGESSDVQFASASPQLQKKSGVSIPIVIMVVSAVVSLAAAGVLIRRRFM